MEDQVNVWRTEPCWTTAGIAKLKGILSADEQRKADRFHREVDFRRSVVGRAFHRCITG
jgi:hypothetical protein